MYIYTLFTYYIRLYDAYSCVYIHMCIHVYIYSTYVYICTYIYTYTIDIMYTVSMYTYIYIHYIYMHIYLLYIYTYYIYIYVYITHIYIHIIHIYLQKAYKKTYDIRQHCRRKKDQILPVSCRISFFYYSLFPINVQNQIIILSSKFWPFPGFCLCVFL